MTPTTSTAESLDPLDPWGFGRSGPDDGPTFIERFEPLDEPVDDDEPLFAALPGLPLAAVGASAARMAPQPQPGPVDRGMRLPFPKQMLGVLGAFAAVIMAQAFYIGFSLTGEASARPYVEKAVISSPPADAAASAVRVGALRVDTGGATAQVLIDGARAGATPFTRADLPAGDHAVRVEFGTGAVIERTITVPARETVSLVLEAPLVAPAPVPARAATPAALAAGWVRVDASFEVQVFEAGQLVGSSTTERIMLTPGAHELELVNAALGYRATMKAVVVPGTLVPLALDTPRVPVAFNAQPWAEVVVDGRVQGETPLANLMLPIGVHQVVLRHPDLGEHTETVTVRATGANRVAADLRR